MRGTMKGFTLVEFVIGLTASAAVALVAVSLLAPARNWILTKDVRSGYSDAEIVVMQVVREIRRIKNPASITAFTATQLSFTNLDNTFVGFTYLASTIEKIGSVPVPHSDVLARNVSSFSFTYLDKDGNVTAVAGNIRTIVVSIAIVSGNYTIRLESAGRLRNLT